MADADFAIGGGGTTTWERLCVGLPTLAISVADNQVPACSALARAGLIHYAGDAAALDGTKLHALLVESFNNPAALANMSEAGQVLVDGLGTLRVLEAIEPTSLKRLQLRSACRDDVAIYFDWVNDPEVRHQAINSEPISWTRHRDWFNDRLSDDQSQLYVLQAGKLPVGQIRFDLENKEARIDYSLDYLVRGRGWAAHLVAMGARRLHEVAPVVLRAEVKVGNRASCAVFRKLGFSETAKSQGEPDLRIFRSSCLSIAADASTMAGPIACKDGSAAATG